MMARVEGLVIETMSLPGQLFSSVARINAEA